MQSIRKKDFFGPASCAGYRCGLCAGCLAEMIAYADDGMKLMMKNQYMEQPLMAVIRKK